MYMISGMGSSRTLCLYYVALELAGNNSLRAIRKLAEEAVTVQRKMVKDLSEMKERINAMEKMLREVE